jgi:hypothetical protein
MSTFKTTLELPASIECLRDGDDSIIVRLADIPAHCLADILVGGATIIVGNTFNSGGKDTPRVERAAKANKRIDSWYAGNYRLVARGETMATLMDEAYRAKLEGALGVVTDAAYRTFKEKTVKDATGKALAKGDKLTFDFFLECRAQVVAKATKADAATVLEDLTAELEAAAKVIQAERAKASNAIDTTGLDF